MASNVMSHFGRSLFTVFQTTVRNWQLYVTDFVRARRGDKVFLLGSEP